MCSYVLPIPTLHVRKYMYVRKRPLHCQHVGLPTTRRCSLMSSVHDVRSFVRSFVRGRPGELGGIFISSAALAVNPGRSSPRSCYLHNHRNDSIEEAPLALPARLAPFFRSAYVNNDKVQLYCLCQCSTAIRWCKCNQSCNISLHERSIGIRIQDSGLYWPFMRGTRRRRKRKRHNAKITRTRKITASRRNALFGMLWGWRHRMLGVEGWNG